MSYMKLLGLKGTYKMNDYKVVLKYKRHGVIDVIETWDSSGETGIEASQKAKECLERYNKSFDPEAGPVYIVEAYPVHEVKTVRVCLGDDYIEYEEENFADLNKEDFYKQVTEYVMSNISVEII